MAALLLVGWVREALLLPFCSYPLLIRASESLKRPWQLPIANKRPRGRPKNQATSPSPRNRLPPLAAIPSPATTGSLPAHPVLYQRRKRASQAEVASPASTPSSRQARSIRLESDSTTHSRFRYFGALASTSVSSLRRVIRALLEAHVRSKENNDTFSETSISPTSPWAPPEQSSNVRASGTAPSRLPPHATVSSPMAKPDSFWPTEKMPVDGTPADRMPARHDWGLRGKLMRESDFATFRPDECRSRDSSDKYNGPRLGK